MSVASTASTTDELSSRIQTARTAVATLHQHAGSFVTNPAACTQIIESLLVMVLEEKAHRVALFSACQQEGLCELYMQMWVTFGFQDQQQLAALDRKQRDALENWVRLQCLILSGTDTGDSDIISRVVACGIVKFSVELLETDLFYGSSILQEGSTISLNLLGTLYNVAKTWNRGAETLRSFQRSEQTVAKYASSSDPAMKTLAIIILTFLLSEEEQKKMLDSTEANIKYMVGILDDCLKSEQKNHVGQFGYSAVEIMDSLRRMAAVEVNKEKIVSAGALPHYAKVLDGSGAYSTEEQKEACKGLWTLAFCPHNKAKIAADVGCMEALRRVATSSETSVKKAAEGALWVIEGEAIRAKALTATGGEAKGSTDVTSGHIMISYNWAVQQQVIPIKDALKAAGYRVWIDIEKMSGSTLEAMSKAVEDASLVLMFFTEKYKLSSACRLEAEYTFNRGKKFIPIKMEDGYRPDGWLGLLLGSKLYFDFTKSGQWETVFNQLCTEINRMMPDSPKDLAAGKITALTAPVAPAKSEPVGGIQPNFTASYSKLVANSWKEKDINHWLTEHKLDRYAQKFSGLSGRHVVALRRLMDTAPDFYYHAIKQDLGLIFRDLLTFSNMLQALD